MSTTIDADSSINGWSSDDASESQPCNFADSDDKHSQQPTLTRHSQLRPAGNGLAFVPFADWRPGRSYNQQPAENIWYNAEWKLSVNNMRKTGELEPGIALSPRQFWKYPKLQAVMKSAKSPLIASDTQILLSVSDRKTSSITKRFSNRFLTDDKCAGLILLKVQRERLELVPKKLSWVGRKAGGRSSLLFIAQDPYAIKALIAGETGKHTITERKRKRQQRDLDSCPTGFPIIYIHNALSNTNTGASSSIPSTPKIVFPTSPTFNIQGSREDAVKAYVVWQCSKVSSQEQKSSYDLAQSLTLDHGLCLYMVYTNQRSSACSWFLNAN
ncbi:LOW QUALITY PROTEIN: hypothetical protein N5P37_005645 [Trichoderma harzianum]|nr:LOW QUALITY PROTEIN: hypothetical protein N5P37_005645 [Trichoderma harzianum]